MAESENRPEQTPENQPQQQPPADQHPAPPPKRRRRWPWVVGAILLLLVIVGALIPTIVSSNWGTGLLVGQINRTLAGRAAIDSLSIGWGRGAEIRGLRIYDDEALILDVPWASTGITFADLVRGNFYDLGNTSVEVASFVLRRYPDGSSNFHKVFRIPPPTDEPLEVPASLRGNVDLTARGTIEQHAPDGTIRVVHIDRAKLTAAIPDINAAIQHDLSLAMRVHDQPPGSIAAKGKVKLFDKNILELAALSADETIAIDSVDMAGLLPLLPPDAGVTMLAGTVNGSFTAQLTGTADTFIEGRANIAQFAFGGPVLQGDVYRTSKLEVLIPRTVVNRDTQRIRIIPAGDAKTITLTADQGTLRAGVDATVQSLQRLAANEPPGDEGSLNLAAEADIAALASQLPNLLHFQRNVKVTSGRLDHNTAITLSSPRAAFQSKTQLANLRGTGPQGPIQASDITINLNAASLGGGGAIPQLRDLSVAFSSGFASVQGGGPSIEKLAINGQANLTDMHRELSQFISLGELGFGGTAMFTLNTDGNLAAENDQAKLQASFVTRDLMVSGLTPEPIRSPQAAIIASATLVRGKNLFIQSISDAAITLQTGNAQAPTIDLAAVAQVAFTQRPGQGAVQQTVINIPSFQLTRGRIVAAAAQKELGAIIPGLQGDLAIQGGILTLAAQGSFADSRLTLASLNFKGEQLSFVRNQGAYGPQDITLQLAAVLSGERIEVSQLAGNLGVAEISLVEPIAIRNLSGPMTATGAVKIAGEMRPTMALVEALQGYASAGQYDFSGAYAITQSIRTEGQTLQLTGKGTIQDLIVGPPAEPIFREPAMVFTNDVSVNQQANTLIIGALGIDMQGSKAISAMLRGRVLDYSAQRNFEDMRLALSYDANQLLQLILPLLDPSTREQIKTLKVAGIVKDREFVISGNYPAEPVKVGARLRQPIEYAKASGSLYFDRVEYTSMPAERIEIPLHLSNGRLRTVYADRPDQFGKPTAFSDGTLDLTGLELAFAGRHMRVTALRPKHQLLNNVVVSEQFVGQFLGGTHPLFAGATAVRGRVSVTIDKLENLPMDDGLINPTAKSEGEGTFRVSFTDFAIVNPLTRIFTTQLAGINLGPDGTLPASIPEAEFRLVPGRAFSSLTMNVGQHTLGFRNGEVRLADNRIQSMMLVVPTQLVPRLRDQKFLAAVPTLDIPLTGSLTAPQINIAGAATNLIQKHLTNPENLLQLLDRDKKPAPKPAEKAPPGTIGKRAPGQ